MFRTKTPAERLPRVAVVASAAALAVVLAACASEGDDGSVNGDEEVETESDADGDTAAGESGEESAASDGDAYYAGRQIDLIVPFDTGGGSDTIARFLAPVLSDHIPGNPTIQVINEPGADTVLGHNEFANREADGTALFLGGGSGNLNYIFDHPDIDYDYADWEALLGVGQGAVVYTSPTTGIESHLDVLDPEEPLIWGARSPEGSDLARLFTAELLGMEFEVIFGYDGSGPTRIAFEQGESNLNVETTTSYRSNVTPMIEEGIAVPLYSQGQLGEDGEIVRDPSVPDLPHVLEVYEDLHGEVPEGPEVEAHRLLTSATAIYNKVLFIHADAPDEAHEAIHAGIEGLLEDPRYDEAIEDALGGYEIDYGEAFDTTFEGIIDPDPDVVQWVIDWAEEAYDSRLGS